MKPVPSCALCELRAEVCTVKSACCGFQAHMSINQIGRVYIWAHDSQGEIALGGHHKVVALAIKEKLTGECYSVKVFNQGIETKVSKQVRIHMCDR